MGIASRCTPLLLAQKMDKRTDGHRDGHGTVFIRLPVRVITCLETKHEGKSKSVFLHGVLQSLTN